MGMFDSVRAAIKCPACKVMRNIEVQFKPYLSKYSPQMSDIKIGQRLPHFPPIPRYEVSGYVCFECCESGRDEQPYDCVVIMEHAVVTRILYPIPEDYRWCEMPRGRNTKKRQEIYEEESRRRRATWEKEWNDLQAGKNTTVSGKILSALTPKSMFMIGKAMAFPLMRGLDYEAIGEILGKPGPHPNYTRGLDGKWRRKKLAIY